MRTNNLNVVKNWSKGKPSKSFNGNLSTDGLYLYSYDLVIGRTDPSGNKVAKLYNAPHKAFESMTTSTHVSYAKNVAGSWEIPFGQRLTKRMVLMMEKK